MTTKLLILVTCFMLAALNGFSQQFEVPVYADPQTREDFVKSEKDIIAAANWLEATPLGTDESKRVLVNAWVLKWVINSPTVTISANEFVTNICKKNPDFLVVFMAAYTRSVLQNNYDTSMVNGYIAGVKGLVALYKLGGKVKKDQLMLAAVQASDEGKLEDWVKTNMNKTKK